MEENNQNVNTGNRGVFPEGEAVPGVIQTTPPVQTTVAPAAEQPAEAAQSQPIVSEGNKNTKTFIRLETKNAEEQVSGIIEIDLISFREKGEESRFLSFDVVGSTDGAQTQTKISISNEQDFNSFKEFISNLNWND